MKFTKYRDNISWKKGQDGEQELVSPKDHSFGWHMEIPCDSGGGVGGPPRKHVKQPGGIEHTGVYTGKRPAYKTFLNNIKKGEVEDHIKRKQRNSIGWDDVKANAGWR